VAFDGRGARSPTAAQRLNNQDEANVRLAPLMLALGSQTYAAIRKALEERLAAPGTRRDIAFSLDIDV
jgi:hypothetical protein